MNRVDVVLASVLALFALRGFWRGFSRELFALVGLIGGLVVAAATYGDAAPQLPASIPEDLRPIVAFAGVFVGVNLAARVVGAVIHRVLGVLLLSPVNRAAGAVLGAAKGAALAGIALLLVRALVPSPALIAELDRSRLARPLLAIAGEIRDSAYHPPEQRRLPLQRG